MLTFYFSSAQTQGEFRMLNNQAFPPLPLPPGTLVKTPRYDYVKGNAYAFDGWKKADLTLQNGKVFNAINVKLNLVDESVIFEGQDQTEMVLNLPLSHITFVNGSTYKTINVNNESGLYEVLEQGTITVLKHSKKTVMESKGYNEVTEKRFTLTTKYYLNKDQNFQEIKLDKKSVANALIALGVTSTAASDAKFNLKKEEDIIAVIRNINQGI
ncbi:hypothetical protein [Pedobacter jejuensis]|nr:hypothetical protein [Pedobacter jejuensis]